MTNGFPRALVVSSISAVGYAIACTWLHRRRVVRDRRVLFAVSALLVVAPWMRWWPAIPAGFSMWVAAIVLLFELALAIAMGLVAAIEVGRWVVRRVGAKEVEPPKKEGLDRREAMIACGALVGGAAPIVWGATKTRFDVETTEVPIRIARLPKALDGMVIVQLSDVHVGPFFGEKDLARAEDLVRAMRPDLVAMTGDAIDSDPRYIAPATSFLARLRDVARFGVAAIPGNHEYYAGVDRVMSSMASAGILSMRNTGQVIAPGDGGGFVLVGADDFYGLESGLGPGPRLDAPLAGLPDDRARILLCHQPFFLAKAAALRYDLVLSGHLHGGQIAPLGPMMLKRSYGVLDGLYAHGDTRMYVSRGLGTSGVPTRVAVRPEITKIVLVAG